MKKKAFFEITRSCNFCLTSHINCPCVAKCIYCIQHIVPISLNVYMHVRNYHCAYVCVQKCPQIHLVVSSGLWQKLISWLYDYLSLFVCLSVVCLSVCFLLLGCLTPVTESHALEQRAVHFWKAFTLPLSWLVDLVAFPEGWVVSLLMLPVVDSWGPMMEGEGVCLNTKPFLRPRLFNTSTVIGWKWLLKNWNRLLSHCL